MTYALFALFLTLAASIYGGAHYYIYRMLVFGLSIQAPAAVWCVRSAFVLLAVSFFAARLLTRILPGNLATAIDWVASLWMGVVFYALLATLVLHAGIALVGHLGLTQTITARLPLAPGVVLTIFSLTLCTGIVASSVRAARGPAHVTRITVPMKNLSPQATGMRIVQLSNLHLGEINGRAWFARLVDQVQVLAPDCILITGDVVDEDARVLVGLRDELRRLQARYGVYAASGNHDFYGGIDEVVRNATAAGIIFLRDSSATIGEGVRLYAVDDPTVQRMGGHAVSFTQVVGSEAHEQPSILMHHQPRRLTEAAATGVDLMLAGHTHNGQIWPCSLIARLIFPLHYGVYHASDTLLYVSRGVGTWGPPMRFLAPPEIVEITLVPQRTNSR